jgi:hypothetical protein
MHHSQTAASSMVRLLLTGLLMPKEAVRLCAVLKRFSFALSRNSTSPLCGATPAAAAQQQQLIISTGIDL